MVNRWFFAAPLCCIFLISAGCGGFATEPVAGKVTFNGKALTQGTVTLVPQSADFPASAQPIGAIQDDGSYLISTAKEVGAPAGEYKVVVRSVKPVDPSDEYSMTKSVIPAVYNSDSTTPLKLVVPSDSYELTLTGK